MLILYLDLDITGLSFEGKAHISEGRESRPVPNIVITYSNGAPLLANQGVCSSFDTTPQRPHRRTELPTAILWQRLLC